MERRLPAVDREGDVLVVPPYHLVPLQLALLVAAAIFLASPIEDPTLMKLGRGWLIVLCYSVASGSCLLRAWQRREHRAPWLLFGVGIASYAAGVALYLVYLQPRDLPASPSIADPLWVAFYPCAYVATVLLIVTSIRRLHWSVWLDGAVLACALAAVARGLILPVVLARTAGSATDVLTSLVYPLGDVLLLGITVWAVAVVGFRLSRLTWLLTAAFLLLTATDAVYVYRIAEGNWSMSVAARIGYPLAMALIGLAAWQPVRPREPVGPMSARVLAVPAVSGMVGATIVVLDRALALPTAAYLLAVAAIVLAVSRVLIYQYGTRELRASLRFERGFRDTPVGMALTSVDGRWLRVNSALSRLLARAPEELVGGRVVDVTYADDVALVADALARGLRGERLEPGYVRLIRPDGTIVETLLAATVIHDPDSGERCFSTHVQDVTAQRSSARQQAAVADLGRRALAANDMDGLFAATVQLVASALGARQCFILESDGSESPLRVRAAVEREIDPGAVLDAYAPAGAWWVTNRAAVLDDVTLGAQHNGSAAHRLQTVVLPIYRAGDALQTLVAVHVRPAAFGPDCLHFLEAVATILASAADRLHSEHALRARALHDPLTGLANRALCSSHLEQAVAHARRTGGLVAVLMLDVDRFKVVNDTLGHSAGDELLQAMAPRLSALVRAEDVASRFGGDEFLLVCGDVASERQVVAVAERIVAAMKQPFQIGGYALQVSVSIGIALAGTGDTDPEALIRNADLAMYRAKDRGGDSFEIFDVALRNRLLSRVETERALRTAVDRDELSLVYQPIVDLMTGELAQFEALLRWNRPGHGQLDPAAFLDVAEESGLIRQIGDWVIRQACTQVAAWSKAVPGRPLPVVAVNLSARQIGPGLVSQIAAEIESSGISSSQLVVELTENLLMERSSAAAVVAELRGLGVSISLDDFGTGYSSLGYLQTFALDSIKVDSAFVHTLRSQTDQAASILNAITEMARALGLSVVAEGVETEQQLALVRRAGCESAQGYLFARPLRAADARSLLDLPTPWSTVLDSNSAFHAT